MKLIFAILVAMNLLGCSSTTEIYNQSICLQSLDQAREVGSEIFHSSFGSRVSYWAYGDANVSIKGIGLKWDGKNFNHSEYCPKGGYPLVILLDTEAAGEDSERILSWAKIVLKRMLKDRNVELLD